MAESLQTEIIEFMFLRNADGQLDDMACLQLWFGKSNETDIEIQHRFGAHVEAALEGAFSKWDETPRGCLAHMILVDQFPRNLFRNNVRSFAGDPIARRIAYSKHDWLESLRPEECIFVPCLVMTHQENVSDQEYGLRFYNTLEPHLPQKLHIFRTIFEEHHRIISLCGTFPHRDHYYPNRKTSDMGRKILDNPQLRFDLPLVCNDGVVSFGHSPTKLWQTVQRSLDIVDRIDALINQTARRRSVLAGDWLTPKESAKMKSVFRQFDKDGSGFLDIEELTTVLTSTGHVYSRDQVQGVVDSATGVENSAGLTFEQFANILRTNLPPAELENRARLRFDLFDRHHSGEVRLEEFAKCIQGIDELITSSEIELMFARADRDHSGSISFDEFLGIMERRGSVDDLKTPLSAVSEKPVAQNPGANHSRVAPVFVMPDWREKNLPAVQVSEIGSLQETVS